MTIPASVLASAIGTIFIAGIMCGIYMLPMKYLGRWAWENMWIIFISISCVLMPICIVFKTVPDFMYVLGNAPLSAIFWSCGLGFAWGFGAIMFGQGISALGVSMSNTLVLAISASLGSFLPMIVLAPERMYHPQGIAIIGGTLIGITGIIFCGYAGHLRERSQKDRTEAVRGKMVGKARSFRTGVFLCAGAGLLSAVLNIGYSEAQPVLSTAVRLGYSTFDGSNLVWLLMLGSGAIPNLCLCFYLLTKNRTWGRFSISNSLPLYSLSVLMGLLWGGDIFLYGYASPQIGKLGPAIGWPIKLIAGLITANIAGFWTGEWKYTQPATRKWMFTGLAILLSAVAALGWSSTLE
jgi:L-rhamnose-H+ transport protein